ncbi:MAG: hemerythrin domain-containing protein [Proteobacteria bacterium]|nr:hemerythrin domain-containing protein [Pseudomonadota bacterium]
MTAREAGALEKPPASLLDRPLAYILADHDRHRRACEVLRRIAKGQPVSQACIGVLKSYLADDVARHHDDEDEVLFPALRRRALPEDELSEVLLRLERDHRESYAILQDILNFLDAAATDGDVAVTPTVAAVILRYTAREIRHLAIENAVVMSIAEVRLTRTDLAAMSRLMKLRRGLEP